jgi:hypothetical protein
VAEEKRICRMVDRIGNFDLGGKEKRICKVVDRIGRFFGGKQKGFVGWWTG